MKKKKIYINPIWGSNFNKGINPLMEEINSSIKFDKRLALQDLKVSKAHCQMLKKQKIISAKDYNLIINGLKKTGLTSFFINEGVDTGDIIKIKEIF